MSPARKFHVSTISVEKLRGIAYLCKRIVHLKNINREESLCFENNGIKKKGILLIFISIILYLCKNNRAFKNINLGKHSYFDN